MADAFRHISRPAVSRHLRVLRGVGLVDAEVAGRERFLPTDTGALREVEAWIARLRPKWNRQLDALDTEVHRTRRQRECRDRRRAKPADPAPTTTKEQSA